MHAGSRSGALVALLFCFSCPARGTREGIDVAVGETSVTLTCPEDDQVLKRSEVEVSQETPWTAKEEGELEQMERGVVYVCNSVKATHKIYLKVKAGAVRPSSSMRLKRGSQKARKWTLLHLSPTLTTSPSGKARGRCMLDWRLGSSELARHGHLIRGQTVGDKCLFYTSP
ncbi:T-cell surface glycoprotein CD3 epsilon chain isoform X2 [Pogona vitticeps]